MAWDLCRRANLINLGCAATYMTGDEAWPLLMEMRYKSRAVYFVAGDE